MKLTALLRSHAQTLHLVTRELDARDKTIRGLTSQARSLASENRELRTLAAGLQSDLLLNQRALREIRLALLVKPPAYDVAPTSTSDAATAPPSADEKSPDAPTPKPPPTSVTSASTTPVVSSDDEPMPTLDAPTPTDELHTDDAHRESLGSTTPLVCRTTAPHGKRRRRRRRRRRRSVSPEQTPEPVAIHSQPDPRTANFERERDSSEQSPTSDTVDSAGDSSEAPAKPPAHEPADSAAGWQQRLVGKYIIVHGSGGLSGGRVKSLDAEDPNKMYIHFFHGIELVHLVVPYSFADDGVGGTTYLQGKPCDTVAPPAPDAT